MTQKQETQQKAALTVAHQDHVKGLNSYAFFKTRDHAMSEDMVQDTFMKTWSYLIRGGKIDLMKAFLYHILNNLIVDHYRKQKTVSLNLLLEKGFEPSAGDHRRMFNVLDGKGDNAFNPTPPIAYQKVDAHAVRTGSVAQREMSLITGQSKIPLRCRHIADSRNLSCSTVPTFSKASIIGRL